MSYDTHQSRNVKGQINNTSRKALSSDLILTSPSQTNKTLDFESQNSGTFLLIPTFTTCSPQSHGSQDQGKRGLKTLLSGGQSAMDAVVLGFWFVCFLTFPIKNRHKLLSEYTNRHFSL